MSPRFGERPRKGGAAAGGARGGARGAPKGAAPRAPGPRKRESVDHAPFGLAADLRAKLQDRRDEARAKLKTKLRGEAAERRGRSARDDDERPASPARPARPTRAARSEWARDERPTRDARPTRDERPSRGARATPDARVARGDRPTRGDGPPREPRPSRGDRPSRSERPARDERATGGERTGPRGARSDARPSRRVAKGEPMRLQRLLARAGVASRRQAEGLITEGRVLVNGEPAQLGQSVDPARDRVTLDGRPVEAPVAAQWLVLNKPFGTLTTRRDPEGRPTVFDLVPDIPGLTYVGRLDYMTEGVLLLTTDGDAAHRLTHPSRGVERTYVAVVRGHVASAVRQARQGIELEDGPVHPVHVEARPLGNRRHEFLLTIAEGRTREVRRVCEALGLEVERLTRVQFGPVRLGSLPVGEVRPLNVTERRLIDAAVRMPAQPRRETDDWD